MAAMERTRSQIASELAAAREQVDRLESELSALKEETPTASTSATLPLSLREYRRYGRQMILNEIGLPGQILLKNASILVIGAGALGCPVLLYLAAAGIGKITIIDHDVIELSNLHRQVLHNEQRIGMSKAESARRTLQALNSDILVEDYNLAFTPSLFSPLNALSTPSALLNPTFSLILDCTDNPSTRHLVNAYAAAHDIPLVSGGAVRSEGIVGVYNLPLPFSPEFSAPERGPCYACVFPPALKPEIPLSEEQIALQGTGACSDEGVLGILCGMVGISMGAEALRVLLSIAKPTLHMFSPLSSSPFRTIKLRNRKVTCPTCSNSKVAWAELKNTGVWPGWEDPLCELVGVGERSTQDSPEVRIRVKELHETGINSHRIVDVRSKTEFGICHLDGSYNVPFPQLLKEPSLALVGSTTESTPAAPIYFVCKKGNDSFLAAKALNRYLAKGEAEGLVVGDVVGGVQAWSRDVDAGFPIY